MFLVMSTYYYDEEEDDNFVDPTDEEMLEAIYSDEDSRPGEDEEW